MSSFSDKRLRQWLLLPASSPSSRPFLFPKFSSLSPLLSLPLCLFLSLSSRAQGILAIHDGDGELRHMHSWERVRGRRLVGRLLLFVMVFSTRDESTQIGGTHFLTNWQNFDSWSKPNKAIFWGNDLTLLIVAKNDFQRYIICLCLDLFAKSHVFQDVNKFPI